MEQFNRYLKTCCGMIFLSFLLFSCEKKEGLTERWGVIKVAEPEVEVEERESVYIEEFQYLIPGRSVEITEALEKDLYTYAEGAFGQDTKKFVEQLFPGVFKSKDVIDALIFGLEEQKKKLKYTLKESYPRYISRPVETDDFIVFAIENRTWFEIEFLPAGEALKNSTESNCNLQYGKDYVTYNEMTNSLIIDGAHVIYGITSKDTLDFFFLSETLMGGGTMRKYVSAEKFLELRRYFEEMAIYQ